MKNIVEKQLEFFNSNKTKSIGFRIEQLKKLEFILIENTGLLNEAIYADFKKSAFDNYTTELALVYTEIHEAIRKVRKWSRTKRAKTNIINFPAKSYIIPEPLGVSLVISAWNYPYQLALAPLVAAIAAGNTVVLKPSELPANTSHALTKIINSNFDPGFLKVVEGGVEETTELLEQHFDKIFFTGSAAIGRIVYSAAAKHLTPVVLELGGKSPAFVTEKCNLEITVKRLIWAKFVNAGQTCIAPDYVLVHSSVKDEFLRLAKAEIEKEQYSFENDNYVQIINDRNMQRLAGLVDTDKIYFGGKYDLEIRYFEPTIINNVTFEDRIMKEEIFGPVLPVIEYDDLDKAIESVRAMPKPLSCYVFTSYKEIKEKVLNGISFGGGCVNDSVMHISNNHLPFGGVGESGIGSYHGENGFKAFTHYKSVLDKPTWIEPNIKYSPHTERKMKLVKFLMRLK
jgi:aldehyde dehydrogenase (NAD+)